MNYEQWIASLGYDREYLIQMKQSSLLKDIFKFSALIHAFALPLTYDLIVIILNSVKTEKYAKLVKIIAYHSPVPLKPLIGTGETYKEALCKVKSLTDSGATTDFNFKTVAVQIDVNGYYNLLNERNPYDIYTIMMSLKKVLQEIADKLGGLTFYAGGDNIIVFLPKEKDMEKFTLEFKTFNIASVKMGVGIAPIPREAVALSTKALSIIRQNRGFNDNKCIILSRQGNNLLMNRLQGNIKD
jgi:GTP cyclohydrolase III